MRPEKTVLRETAFVAVGTLILSVIINAVFLIIGKWSLSVLLGNILSGIPSVINFFLMGMTVQKAVGETGKAAENFMRVSMLLRTVILFVVAIVGVCNPDTFNLVSVLVPLFFPRISIALRPLFGMDSDKDAVKGENAGTAESEASSDNTEIGDE